MVQRVEQVRTVASDGSVTDTTRRTSDEPAPTTTTAQPASYTAVRVIWYIAGVIVTLLLLRFLLVLLGANQGNPFVSFLYSVSYPFAAPFFGIFSYNVHYGVARFEASTLVAVLIYLLIAWGLTRLVAIRHPEVE